MHTSKEQNNRKRIFIQNHLVLCKDVLSIHPATIKLHKTPNGRLLVSKARTVLGYSPKTYDADILHSMLGVFEEVTGINPYKTTI